MIALLNSTGTGRMRVLVVDDNRDGADTFALLLRIWGYDVQVAYSGREAVETAHGFKPNCVLSDIGMPGFDGYRLAEEFRHDDVLKGTLLIAITAMDDRARALAAGFDYHFVKPADPVVLEKILAKFSGTDDSHNN